LRHSRIVGFADVDQLVAERVGDDGGVEGFALAAAGEGVGDLEGEFVGGAAVGTRFEDYCGRAKAKVRVS
jgi:hypothetical protein